MSCCYPGHSPSQQQAHSANKYKKGEQILEYGKETLLDFSAGFLFIITAHTKHALGLPWITNTVHVCFSKASNCRRVCIDFIVLLDCADLTDEPTLRLQSLRGHIKAYCAVVDGTQKWEAKDFRLSLR